LIFDFIVIKQVVVDLQKCFTFLLLWWMGRWWFASVPPPLIYKSNKEDTDADKRLIQNCSRGIYRHDTSSDGISKLVLASIASIFLISFYIANLNFCISSSIKSSWIIKTHYFLFIWVLMALTRTSPVQYWFMNWQFIQKRWFDAGFI
jgi:hypothetical protein